MCTGDRDGKRVPEKGTAITDGMGLNRYASLSDQLIHDTWDNIAFILGVIFEHKVKCDYKQA